MQAYERNYHYLEKYVSDQMFQFCLPCTQEPWLLIHCLQIHDCTIQLQINLALKTKAGSNSKFFGLIHIWFLPHWVQFRSVSNFDIDFINFWFVLDTTLARGKKISQLHDMKQF